MGLSSFFKRNAAPPPAADAVDEVQQLRKRSRQRLVGAAVLIAAGVIGFPLVFETQPRPIAIDIPIEIARKDQVPPLVIPPPRVRPTGPPEPVERSGAAASGEAARPPAPITKAPDESVAGPKVGQVDALPKAAQPQATSKAAQPNPAPKVARADVKPVPPPPVGKPARAEEARARALLDGRDATKKDEIVAAAGGRFVVQVGAFAEEAAAREMRQRVERIGLKTHLQSAATSGGSRIHRVRVGPFTSREEAERIAARLESAGLSCAVLGV